MAAKQANHHGLPCWNVQPKQITYCHLHLYDTGGKRWKISFIPHLFRFCLKFKVWGVVTRDHCSGIMCHLISCCVVQLVQEVSVLVSEILGVCYLALVSLYYICSVFWFVVCQLCQLIAYYSTLCSKYDHFCWTCFFYSLSLHSTVAWGENT